MKMHLQFSNAPSKIDLSKTLSIAAALMRITETAVRFAFAVAFGLPAALKGGRGRAPRQTFALLQARDALNHTATPDLLPVPFGDALTASLRGATLSVAERADHSPHSLNQQRTRERPLAAPLPLPPFGNPSNPNTPHGTLKGKGGDRGVMGAGLTPLGRDARSGGCGVGALRRSGERRSQKWAAFRAAPRRGDIRAVVAKRHTRSALSSALPPELNRSGDFASLGFPLRSPRTLARRRFYSSI